MKRLHQSKRDLLRLIGVDALQPIGVLYTRLRINNCPWIGIRRVVAECYVSRPALCPSEYNFVQRCLFVAWSGDDVLVISRDVAAQHGWRFFGLKTKHKWEVKRHQYTWQWKLWSTMLALNPRHPTVWEINKLKLIKWNLKYFSTDEVVPITSTETQEKNQKFSGIDGWSHALYFTNRQPNAVPQRRTTDSQC